MSQSTPSWLLAPRPIELEDAGRSTECVVGFDQGRHASLRSHFSDFAESGGDRVQRLFPILFGGQWASEHPEVLRTQCFGDVEVGQSGVTLLGTHALSRDAIRTPVLMPTTSMPASSNFRRVCPIFPGENSSSEPKIHCSTDETDFDARISVFLGDADDLLDSVIRTADGAETK